MNFDLNCDLGENEPRRLTSELMRLIDSANIACGGHAGNIDTMRACVRLARKHAVKIGAHPSFQDRKGFGRDAERISAANFKTLLLQQVGALQRIAADEGLPLHHIKLHGALYHLVEEQPALRRAYFEMIREFWPEVVVFSFAGGPVSREAEPAGVKSWGEGFLDRVYIDESRLVPRNVLGGVLSEGEFDARLRLLVEKGFIESIALEHLRIPARTWCVHGDTESALEIAERARAAFGPR